MERTVRPYNGRGIRDHRSARSSPRWALSAVAGYPGTLLASIWSFLVGLDVLVGAVLSAYLVGRLDADSDCEPFEEVRAS